ncbi:MULTISPECIES: glycerol-3-phosphate 1-O-acyltransferase PlsY [Synechococcaceae]|uniref:glycerol-3-phosphate 1-O-acyltransferase PlsY n=1 Tax=Synechococcaceae TaxID=1890426 RepID=UPI0008FF0CA9|nr:MULTISPECIES: glycerol-3-phosphate 1-O-acyltransferase PlsY [Synechococcaceae]MCT4365378.1 glycerol-3-phosphate 1-O-acyltransferase PlsY [Candidatus Regnicoccus frigidus MAG-AL1]APD47574.1 acyl-phosphate glycerol 3-phosphate acyltransferase [Synechococcus sp. SynAce01]MCT0202442.1 glycerol-3-phosphate 1-O-acyltransferase PlsY [Synechococcus sp. CS-603]MCT0247089.1 glycerol-3-phosphate 1-O-acyltransferase PlsY [Synechococcus sp. CS-601]MCT4368275.1 glycerol-3-phosphate 1-O-acyltransferase Pl
MNALLPLVVMLTGYLLGSIPFGWLAGRWWGGIDLRELGSGSTGATNVLRQMGKGPALVVFLLDVLKGSAAVLLAKALLQPLLISDSSDWWVVAAGLAALAGHIWPIWLGCKGGKAVATGLGMLLGLVPAVGLACFGLFLATLTVSRIVSLSSVVAALSLPLLMQGSFMTAGTGLRPAYLALAVLTTVLVVWRHRANLGRLIAGTEPKLGSKSGAN